MLPITGNPHSDDVDRLQTVMDDPGKTVAETKIGVAGCGSMGLPMAKALLAAGFDVHGFDIRPAEDFLDFKGRMIQGPKAFADTVNVLISVVRDQQQTLDLYFQQQAIFCQPVYPKICLLASTVSPRFIEQISNRLPDDVLFFEIPMSGAPIAAEQARLSFMVGASPTTAAPILPLLEAMGQDLHFLGGRGKGMACKVLNNFVAAASVTAVRQVLSAAGQFQIPPDQLLAVMKSSSGGTWYGDHFDSIAWANENHDPANTIGIIEKDVNSLLDVLQGGKTDSESLDFIKQIRDRLLSLPASPKAS